MRRRIWLFVLLFVVGLWGQPAAAQGGLLGGLLSNVGGILNSLSGQPQGVIVRTNLGLSGLQNVCLLKGCTVVGSLDGNANQVFLVRPAQGLLANLLAAVLRLVTGILDAEVDQLLAIPPNPSSPTATTPPPGLWDRYPVNYFGTTVWDGYADQPAARIVEVAEAHATFHVTGSGIVADIDTGVDPNHPALKSILLTGYDFTRNEPGGSEMRDISLASPPPCDSCPAAYVNQHTAAMVDQHTAAMVDGTAYAAFGHGTMVAGVIHLVAPTAHILPLKAFHPDGTGNLSDIIRAVYYAVQNHANVINMSFDLSTNSTELTNAINYAASHNVVSVASSGNDGKEEVVYPAALQNVMGVASTDDFDRRSSFSNYGNQVVWVAAPGEAIITTYPFGTYAAGWGTSFSSPFVAGTASLLLNMQSSCGQTQAPWAISHAQWIGSNMGHGRLDIVRAVSALDEHEGENRKKGNGQGSH